MRKEVIFMKKLGAAAVSQVADNFILKDKMKVCMSISELVNGGKGAASSFIGNFCEIYDTVR